MKILWLKIGFILNLSLSGSFLLLLLQSCSKTEIGKQLADSFETQSQPKSVEKKTNYQRPKQIKTISKKTSPEPIRANNLAKKINKRTNDSLPTKKFVPQPYRITIKLSGANPSAPAEPVTKALRKAGIIFEVEKIERIDYQKIMKNSIIKGDRF